MPHEWNPRNSDPWASNFHQFPTFHDDPSDISLESHSSADTAGTCCCAALLGVCRGLCCMPRTRGKRTRLVAPAPLKELKLQAAAKRKEKPRRRDSRPNATEEKHPLLFDNDARRPEDPHMVAPRAEEEDVIEDWVHVQSDDEDDEHGGGCCGIPLFSRVKRHLRAGNPYRSMA
jgi:hypothetical protein